MYTYNQICDVLVSNITLLIRWAKALKTKISVSLTRNKKPFPKVHLTLTTESQILISLLVSCGEPDIPVWRQSEELSQTMSLESKAREVHLTSRSVRTSFIQGFFHSGFFDSGSSFEKLHDTQKVDASFFKYTRTLSGVASKEWSRRNVQKCTSNVVMFISSFSFSEKLNQ